MHRAMPCFGGAFCALIECKATRHEAGGCSGDGIECGCAAEVKNVFKGVGDLLSLASANAFKGDAVSTVRCGNCMPSKLCEIMQWHSLPSSSPAGPQGALRSFNMTSEDPAACPALLCKSRPAAIAACNAYRVSTLCISLPRVVAL